VGAAVHVIGQWLLTALAAARGVAAAERGDVMPAPGAQREGDRSWCSAVSPPAVFRQGDPGAALRFACRGRALSDVPLMRAR